MSLLLNSVTARTLWNFDPRSLPDCVLWLDAADTRTITGTNPVTAWENKGSAGGSATNSTGSFTSGVNTENGLNYITSPVGSEMRFTAALPSQARSWFIVARLLTQLSLVSGADPRYWSPVNTTAVVSGQDSAVGYRQTATGYAMQIGPGGIAVTLGSQSLPSPLNVIGVYGLVNSSTTTANNVVTFNGTSYALSSNALASSFLVNSQTYSINRVSYNTAFEIFEIIHYAREVTVTERKMIEAYLMWKWGIIKINESTFVPTSITTCALWFHSDVDFNNAASRDTCFTFSAGDSVSTWKDLSGNGRNATFHNVSPSTTRPVLTQNRLNGKPVVIFNGTNALKISYGLGSTQAHTVFAVAASTSLSAFRAVLSLNCVSTSRGTLLTIYQSSSNFWWYSGGTGATDGTTASISVSSGRYDILGFNWSTTLRTLMNINGHAIQSSGSSPTALRANAETLIGSTTTSGTTSPAELWSGGIAEIILYTELLTAPQRNMVERYLSLKWNRPLVNAGALTHPNRLLPPFQRPFLPIDISSCQLWLDAADASTITLNGSTVSQWRDKSLNGYSVNQANASLQPTYTTSAQNGLSGIQFSVSTYLSTLSTNMPNFTTGASSSLFVAARNASTNTGWNIISTIWFDITTTPGVVGGGTSRYHFSFNQGGTPGPTLFANGALVGQVTSNVIATSANAIVGFTLSSTSSTININGTTYSYSGVTLPNATGNSEFLLGDPRNNSSLSNNIMIFEVVGFNSQLNAGERQLVERYLADKWGLRSSYAVTPFTVPNSPQIFPTTFADIALWLDASDPDGDGLQPTSGTNTRQWVDKSGSSKTCVQTTDARCPFFSTSTGIPAIVFNAANQLHLIGPSLLTSTSYGIFVVAEFQGTTGIAGTYTAFFDRKVTTANAENYVAIYPYFFSSGDRTAMNIYYTNNSTTPTYKIYNAATATPTSRKLYTISDSSTATTPFFINGANVGSTNVGATANVATDAEGYRIGVSNLAGTLGNYFTGRIYEVIVMLHTPTTQERQYIEAYLSWKWGLQTSLSTTNPFYKLRT